MKSNYFPLFLLTFTLFIGCKTSQTSTQTYKKNTTNQEVKTPIREYSVLATLWQQHAAEYRALTYQAYNIAKIQLESILANSSNTTKPLAIVTDIDETLLNNSAFNGKLIELNEDYTDSRWIEWGKEEKAGIVPGALEFFNYAKSKNIEIFYITNRLEIQKNETLSNLKKLNFPYADEQHLLLKQDTSGKETRRIQVQKTHNIIMLIGDNLSDFSPLFDKKPAKKRNELVDILKNAFGTKYIVLPNPMYGDWETKGILEGKYNWTDFQKDSIRKSKIKSY